MSEKINDYNTRIETFKKNAEKVFSDAGKELVLKKNKSIRIVFVGPKSGKSSIIKMLTGREDIEIGITAEISKTYIWNDDIELVDTPRILTGRNPGHDEETHNAIISADMIIFVITSELFNPSIGNYFKKLAFDKDKAGEMMLVVNKMARTGKNDEEQRAIIREGIRDMLKPDLTPEQLHIAYLDAESYLDSINESDEELKNDLMEISGYNDFVEALDRFIKEKKETSKLTTDLYNINDQLEKEIGKLENELNDPLIDSVISNFKQQHQLICDIHKDIEQDLKVISEEAYEKIINSGKAAAGLFEEGCDREKVEEELDGFNRQIESIRDQYICKAVKEINTHWNELGKQLDDIENSEYSQNLKLSINGRIKSIQEDNIRPISDAGSVIKKVGQLLEINSRNPEAGSGLKLTNFTGSKIHELISETKHAMNIKSKPWQNVKSTKSIFIAGEAIDVIGTAIPIAAQIISDIDEKKVRENLKKNRENVRSQAKAIADDLKNLNQQLIRNVTNILNEEVHTMNKKIEEIKNARTRDEDLCGKFKKLKEDCQLLINDIHSMNG